MSVEAKLFGQSVRGKKENQRACFGPCVSFVINVLLCFLSFDRTTRRTLLQQQSTRCGFMSCGLFVVLSIENWWLSGGSHRFELLFLDNSFSTRKSTAHVL